MEKGGHEIEIATKYDIRQITAVIGCSTAGKFSSSLADITGEN